VDNRFVNLKALAQIIFLSLSSIVIAALSILFARTIFYRQIQAVLIPVSSPENAVIIAGRKLCIGRSSECDIIVVDPSVSSRHCLIIHKGDGFFLKDLGSVNGTFVNEIPVSYIKLNDGDLLKIGEKKFIFKIG
jgi:pSer/pThr/pTyr-binding forkhead associated (FHA) protein